MRPREGKACARKQADARKLQNRARIPFQHQTGQLNSSTAQATPWPHSPQSDSTVHRPAPIMIVAIPSFIAVPAYVTLLLCRSNSYATPSAAALIQRSSNRWIERGSPSTNDILFDTSSIQKFKISLICEELLPVGLSMITTLFVTQVRGTRLVAPDKRQIATRRIAHCTSRFFLRSISSPASS
jgi:hypothetical protein